MLKCRIFILFSLLLCIYSSIKSYFITLDIIENPENHTKIFLCGDYHNVRDNVQEIDKKKISQQQKQWIVSEIESANPLSPIYLLLEGQINHTFEELQDTSSIIKQIALLDFDKSKFSVINIENRPLCSVYAAEFFDQNTIPLIEGYPPNKVQTLVLPNLFDFSYSNLRSSFKTLFTEYASIKDKLDAGKKDQFKEILCKMQKRYKILKKYVSECEPQLDEEDCLLTYASKLWFDSVIESCKSYNIDLNKQMMSHTPMPITLLNGFCDLRFDTYNQVKWESVVSQQLHPFYRVILRCIEDLKIPDGKFYKKFFDKDNRRYNLLEKIIECFSGFIDANIFLTLETKQKESPKSNIIVMAGQEHTIIVKKMLLNCGYKLIPYERNEEDPLTQQDFHTIFNIENAQN